jgi:hypothetical protein
MYNQVKDSERQKYRYFLFFASLLFSDAIQSNYFSEKIENECSIEIYKYNEDSTLLKIKNYFDKDIEIISINVFDDIKKEFEKTKE